MLFEAIQPAPQGVTEKVPFAASPMQKWDISPGLRALATIALVMVLLFVTQSFNFLFREANPVGLVNASSVRSNPIYWIFVAVQAAIVGYLFLIHILSQPITARLMAGGAIAAFVLASALWSVEASATLVPGVIFSFLIVAAYSFAVYFDPADFVRTLFWTMAFIILASFVLLVIAPEMANHSTGEFGVRSSNDFKGILSTKNRAGMLFASAVMMSLLAGSLRISLVCRIGVAILGLAGVVLTNAATAVVVLMFVTSLAVWLKYVRVLRFEIAFSVAIILLALVLALPFIDFSQFNLFEIVGRDGSLTGRDQLWKLALQYIEQRPVLGYGYYGFFSADPYSPAWSFWENFRYFLTGSFHNSAADVAISLGLTGVAVLCGVCLGSFFIVFNRTIDAASRCVLILLVHVSLVDSMTNFSIFFHNSFATFIVFYAFFAAGQRYAGNSSASLEQSNGKIRD